MTDALVGALAQELVKDVAALIQEQAQYVLQFQDQFQELEKQMRFMQSFVVDALKKKDNRATVKTTIASLQEVIYEADDLVVDCQIREDYQKKKGGSTCFLSPSEMAFRRATGKKLAKINTEIKKMRESISSYYGPITAHVGGDDSLGGKRRWSSEILAQNEIVGLIEDSQTIKDWIHKQEESLLHVGIIGLGGSGKTTLAKKIYNDTMLTRRYQQKIWISVSERVNVVEIMRSILDQLGEKNSASNEGEMLKKINMLLLDKTYLVVLDDVWSIDSLWWGQLHEGLPKLEENKNCIIITSRNKEVVRGMGVVEGRVLQPKKLTDAEGWDLFCRAARISNNDAQSLKDVGTAIVARCGGLPLAIKTIGGVLALKESKSVTELENIEKTFHENLMKASDHSEGNETVIASLQLSYDELPSHLKPCLLCFSIYPEDNEIDVEQLTHWWAGEGFVRKKTGETVKEQALNCLSELISRCLVEVAQQRNFNGVVTTCKVHDMVRDLTIKIARDEEFCSFDGDLKLTTNSSSRRLGVGIHTRFQQLRGNQKLRALLLTGTDIIGFNRDIGLAKVRSLRVLDLSQVKLDTIIVRDFWEWITALKRLAYLNLRDVTKLSEVPDTISKMWGLQVLVLEECKSLKKLPMSISKLPRLIYLNVINCPQLGYLPRGFSQLSNLQELYGFKVSCPANPAGSQLSELENLTELRFLHIDITEESRIQDQELETLKKLEKLKMLSINAGGCQGSQDNDILTMLGKLSPPPFIEELYLKHYMGETMPGWINPKKLEKLQYLCMESSRVNKMGNDFWAAVDAGGKAETGTEIDAEKCEWKIRGLCLKFCQMLDLSFKEVKAAMPRLGYLEICQCNSLKGFPMDVAGMDIWRP